MGPSPPEALAHADAVVSPVLETALFSANYDIEQYIVEVSNAIPTLTSANLTPSHLPVDGIDWLSNGSKVSGSARDSRGDDYGYIQFVETLRL